MYGSILTNTSSCLNQWMQESRFSRRLTKGPEYVKRLDALDELEPSKSKKLFLMLNVQIQMHSDNGKTDRAAVLRLSADECRSVLRELHKSLETSGLSRELNHRKFETVNFYSSERAKGKVYALYEYMLEKNNQASSAPTEISASLPSRLSDNGARDRLLRRLDLTGSSGTPPLEPVSAPIVPTVPARKVGLRTGHPVQSTSFYPPEMTTEVRTFLENGVQQGLWRRREGINLAKERWFLAALKDLNYLIAENTVANYDTLSTELARATARLSSKYSEPITTMAKKFLGKNLTQSNSPLAYRTTIDRLMGSQQNVCLTLGDKQFRFGDGRQSTAMKLPPLPSLVLSDSLVSSHATDPYGQTDSSVVEVIIDRQTEVDDRSGNIFSLQAVKEFTKKIMAPKPMPEPVHSNPTQSLLERTEIEPSTLTKLTDDVSLFAQSVPDKLTVAASAVGSSLATLASKTKPQLGGAASNMSRGMATVVSTATTPVKSAAEPVSTKKSLAKQWFDRIVSEKP